MVNFSNCFRFLKNKKKNTLKATIQCEMLIESSSSSTTSTTTSTTSSTSTTTSTTSSTTSTTTTGPQQFTESGTYAAETTNIPPNGITEYNVYGESDLMAPIG